MVAVVDVAPARLTHIHELYPEIRCYTDPGAVLADNATDAVVVATPTSTHYPLVRQALLAGKHVLCEKPLCETSAQAMELVALSQSQGLILMVGHVFLFNAGLVKVKDLIGSGDLGRLHYVSAIRTNLGPIRHDVNVAYDLATHDISIFNWLLGCEPELVSATGGSFLQPCVEDVVFISLKYPGNVFASIQASWLNPKKVRQM